jgi:hypothetical protein
MESPLPLTRHGGFGEKDGETHLSKVRKVRPVFTPRSGGGVGDRPADHNLGRQTDLQYQSLPQALCSSDRFKPTSNL